MALSHGGADKGVSNHCFFISKTKKDSFIFTNVGMIGYNALRENNKSHYLGAQGKEINCH